MKMDMQGLYVWRKSVKGRPNIFINDIQIHRAKYTNTAAAEDDRHFDNDE